MRACVGSVGPRAWPCSGVLEQICRRGHFAGTCFNIHALLHHCLHQCVLWCCSLHLREMCSKLSALRSAILKMLQVLQKIYATSVTENLCVCMQYIKNTKYAILWCCSLHFREMCSKLSALRTALSTMLQVLQTIYATIVTENLCVRMLYTKNTKYESTT